MDNLNILVEAKKELLSQLTTTIIPNALECMERLYSEAKMASQGKMALKTFQEYLADIPKWNNYQIENEVAKSTDTCGGCLDEMIAATFVATVKIISSVRLSKDSRRVKLKIPTNDVFILGVYTNIARRLYEDPYIFQDITSKSERRKELIKRMDGVIEETVKDMLPMNQILKTYLNKNATDMMNQDTEELHSAVVGSGGDDGDASGSDDDEDVANMGDGPLENSNENAQVNDENMGKEDDDEEGSDNPMVLPPSEVKEIKFNESFRSEPKKPEENDLEDDNEEMFINSGASR